jgi:3,4-dihydroxy 2-butanone 4-phosphate synthase/GTP cyclohydrolase II
VTTDKVNMMLRAKGMICLALEPARVASLGLALQARENTDALRTAFTVSIDAAPKYGVTPGISASDRATTIRVAADPTKGPADIRTPGHVHPLRARGGGVLQRVGHTEAAVDLCRLAGLTPAGVICEILDEDGHPMRRDALDRYASLHGLSFITVADLVAHRLTTERLVHRVAEARLPTDIGSADWRVYAYRNDVDDHEHVAIAYGDLAASDSVLVRMHSKCLTGDVFHSRRCDCGWQLHKAMEAIAAEGRGVIVYLDQEGRGIGLLNKIKAPTAGRVMTRSRPTKLRFAPTSELRHRR